MGALAPLNLLVVIGAHVPPEVLGQIGPREDEIRRKAQERPSEGGGSKDRGWDEPWGVLGALQPLTAALDADAFDSLYEALPQPPPPMSPFASWPSGATEGAGPQLP